MRSECTEFFSGTVQFPRKIIVYDALGKEVAMLFEGVQEAGIHVATFDGSRFSSGVHFCTLQAGNFRETRKLTVLI